MAVESAGDNISALFGWQIGFTMFRIESQYPARVLENLVAANVVNLALVHEEVADDASVALQRMLEV